MDQILQYFFRSQYDLITYKAIIEPSGDKHVQNSSSSLMEEPMTSRIPSNVQTVEKESAMNRFILNEDVSKAEVLWSLYTTVNHIYI